MKQGSSYPEVDKNLNLGEAQPGSLGSCFYWLCVQKNVKIVTRFLKLSKIKFHPFFN